MQRAKRAHLAMKNALSYCLVERLLMLGTAAFIHICECVDSKNISTSALYFCIAIYHNIEAKIWWKRSMIATESLFVTINLRKVPIFIETIIRKSRINKLYVKLIDLKKGDSLVVPRWLMIGIEKKRISQPDSVHRERIYINISLGQIVLSAIFLDNILLSTITYNALSSLALGLFIRKCFYKSSVKNATPVR